MNQNKDLNFSFSDLIGGYVTSPDRQAGTFGIRTTDGREFQARLTPMTYAELVRNLGEPYADATGRCGKCSPRSGMCSPTGSTIRKAAAIPFDAKHLLFLGRAPDEYRFEKQDWWIKPDPRSSPTFTCAPSSATARPTSATTARPRPRGRQDCDFRAGDRHDLASRLRLRDRLPDDRRRPLPRGGRGGHAVPARSLALRRHDQEDIAYWYHASTSAAPHERKIFASEFGDDYDAIPMYEQIYALAGPTQTYRITGDPRSCATSSARSASSTATSSTRHGRLLLARRPDHARPEEPVARRQPRPQELEFGRRPRPGLPDQPLAGHRRRQHAAMLDVHRRHDRRALP